MEKSTPTVSASSHLHALKKNALSYHQRGELDKAITCYEKYLQINSGDAGIWSNLGSALRQGGHYQSAVNCHIKACKLQPEDSVILTNLANALKDADQFEAAIKAARQAVDIDPGDINLWFNYAVILREAMQFSEALSAFDQCLRIEKNNAAKYRWEKALCYLYLGDFVSGWKDYEARWDNDMLPARRADIPLWNGEPLQQKTLLLHQEQGFGDAILITRYLTSPALHGAKVVLECRPPLLRLFKELPVRCLSTEESRGAAGVSADYQCGIMSLPGLLDTDLSSMPPPIGFDIPVQSRAKLTQVIKRRAAKLNIGIVWSGSTTFADNRRRSPGLKHFLPLAQIPGVQLFSLQKGPCERDLERHFARSYIIDLAPYLNDFADTAAAIEQLDMIVMSDSAVAHLAGSLGKPVINLLQYKPYWLYMPLAQTTPWYPSMRLIRQPEPGDWESVFAQLNDIVSRNAQVANNGVVSCNLWD